MNRVLVSGFSDHLIQTQFQAAVSSRKEPNDEAWCLDSGLLGDFPMFVSGQSL